MILFYKCISMKATERIVNPIIVSNKVLKNDSKKYIKIFGVTGDNNCN